MKPITLQQIRQAVNGKALTSFPAAHPPIQNVHTDTRLMEPASLFVALRDQRDGHSFIPDAAARGALAALVDEKFDPAQILPNLHYIQVPDTRLALGKLARFVRGKMQCKVIAVAGSNGKTSTKHLIDSALRPRLRGSISPKSFNNDIGVPLTIFPADPLQDYLVLELGTNHPGEISYLTQIAQPDIAVITNCSAEHLEGLGNLDGVRKENASLIEGLNPNGLLVINGDDPELLAAVCLYKGKRVTFGFSEQNDLFATEVVLGKKGTRFRPNNRKREIFVPLLGRHTASNALAAIAVARKLNVDEEEIYAGLSGAHGPDMRLQLQSIGGISVLNDAYNANPASMKAALETVCGLPTSGRRIAVLGDMRELGRSSDQYHREIGKIAGGCGLHALVCVGAKAALIAESACEAGMPADRVSHRPDVRSAAQVVPEWLRSGDLVLLKASRAIHLEDLAAAISASAESKRLRDQAAS
jgi:UDP-N-acetylmuramoyl-tripeptide--D-alanyl-D-alanine ligase